MRKPILLLAGLLLILPACNLNDPALEAIEVLEQAVETDPSKENIQQLAEAYRAYVDANPESAETNAELLYKSATLHQKTNKLSEAIDLLKEALKNYYDSKHTPRNALLLADIYRNNLNNPEGANAVYQALRKSFPQDKLVAQLPDSLLAGQPSLEESLESLRANIYNNTTNRIEYRVANDFIGVCEIFGLLLPNDTKTPAHLHEAGKTAGYIRSFNKAIELYEWIYNRYPESEKAPQSLFMLAFTYDNEMKDGEKARELYEAFIEKYPDNDFADDARFLLGNLGKSDEEIIESFGQEGATQ